MLENKNNKSAYKQTFFIVPSYILELPDLELSYLKVFETIFQFWNKGLICYLSNTAICERTGVTDRQIFKALAYLEKHGELKRVQKGLKRFLIQPEKTIETDCIENDEDCVLEQGCTEITQDYVLEHPPLFQTSPPPVLKVIQKVKNLNKELEKEYVCEEPINFPEYKASENQIIDERTHTKNELKKEALNCPKNILLFKTKFINCNITLEELYEKAANEVYGHVLCGRQRFHTFLKKEFISNYQECENNSEDKEIKTETAEERSKRYAEERKRNLDKLKT